MTGREFQIWMDGFCARRPDYAGLNGEEFKLVKEMVALIDVTASFTLFGDDEPDNIDIKIGGTD